MLVILQFIILQKLQFLKFISKSCTNYKLNLLLIVLQTELLLETQAHVVERFVTGMMAKDRKKQQSSENDDDTESVNEIIEGNS